MPTRTLTEFSGTLIRMAAKAEAEARKSLPKELTQVQAGPLPAETEMTAQPTSGEHGAGGAFAGGDRDHAPAHLGRARSGPPAAPPARRGGRPRGSLGERRLRVGDGRHRRDRRRRAGSRGGA